jgi:hypothetical protein
MQFLYEAVGSSKFRKAISPMNRIHIGKQSDILAMNTVFCHSLYYMKQWDDLPNLGMPNSEGRYFSNEHCILP